MYGGMSPFRRPWTIVENPESFEVLDADGVKLAFVYFEDEPLRRALVKRLSKDEARRLAKEIARLPALVRIARGMDPDEPE